jgi:hypothetical protein
VWGRAKRRLTRTFKLEIQASKFSPDVRHVLDALENDTLMVFRPDDASAFVPCFADDGALLVNHRATLPVSIREWLPLGCQWIGLADDIPTGKSGSLAWYETNWVKVICPIHDRTPLGPSALIGDIYLTDQCLPKDDSPDHLDAFHFVVAHELVHVFDPLRFVVPAAMNWRQFSEFALGNPSGSGNLECEDAIMRYQEISRFVDDYGRNNERAMVTDYWPSFADRWFAAMDRVWRSKKD